MEPKYCSSFQNAKSNGICVRAVLDSAVLILLTQELLKPLKLAKKIQRSMFQTFWKHEGCPDFLFLELETSNFGYILAYFFISFNCAKFQQDWTTLI